MSIIFLSKLTCWRNISNFNTIALNSRRPQAGPPTDLKYQIQWPLVVVNEDLLGPRMSGHGRWIEWLCVSKRPVQVWWSSYLRNVWTKITTRRVIRNPPDRQDERKWIILDLTGGKIRTLLVAGCNSRWTQSLLLLLLLLMSSDSQAPRQAESSSRNVGLCGPSVCLLKLH